MADGTQTPIEEAIEELHEILADVAFPLSKDNLIDLEGDKMLKSKTLSLSLRQILIAAPAGYFYSKAQAMGSVTAALRSIEAQRAKANANAAAAKAKAKEPAKPAAAAPAATEAVEVAKPKASA